MERSYTGDEQRVADFLSERGLGGGEDPIGFILCSYAYVISERNELKKQNVVLNQALASAHVVFAAEVTSMQEQIKDLEELREAAYGWNDQWKGDNRMRVISAETARLGMAVQALRGGRVFNGA